MTTPSSMTSTLTSPRGEDRVSIGAVTRADAERSGGVVVVGLGRIGLLHLRTYLALRSRGLVSEVWACDRDPERVAVACRCFPEARLMASGEPWPAQAQLVSVCVPPSEHARVATPLLERGVHALVEKPLAHELSAAREMLDAAQRGGARLFTGHSERFNPATLGVGLPRTLDAARGFFAQRVSTGGPSHHDVDVVLDLMIHDLDLARAWMGPLEVLEGSGRRGVDGRLMSVEATLRASSGAQVQLLAAWSGARACREVSMDTDAGRWRLNMLDGQVVEAPRGERVEVAGEDDAMSRQLIGFVAACSGQATGEPTVLATGRDGLRALELALQIQALAHGP